jgi:hypothetical protein
MLQIKKHFIIAGSLLALLFAFQNCSGKVGFEDAPIDQSSLGAEIIIDDSGAPLVVAQPPAPVTPAAPAPQPVVEKVCPELSLDFAGAIAQDFERHVPVTVPPSELFNDVVGVRGQTWSYSNSQTAAQDMTIRLYSWGGGNTGYKLNGQHVHVPNVSFCQKRYGYNSQYGQSYGLGYWVTDVKLKAGDKIQLGMVSLYAGDITSWLIAEIDGQKSIWKVKSFDYETIGGRNWNRYAKKSTGMQGGMKCSGGTAVDTLTYNKTDRQGWGQPKSCLDIAQASREINCVQDFDGKDGAPGYCVMYKNAKHVSSGDPYSAAAAYLE